jgi:chaperonin cofactor prefoldin
MTTAGYGGQPPASLTKSVEQLATLTEEVSKIRDSLQQIDRPAAAPGDLSGGGSRIGLAPITPDRRAGGVAPKKKLKGLAGVIAARNERDKKRMDELVRLVQTSLGAMEKSLEDRLEQLESRVGEVRRGGTRAYPCRSCFPCMFRTLIVVAMPCCR